MFLGGSTKAFKSYGKRKTHTINKKTNNLWAEDDDDQENKPTQKGGSNALNARSGNARKSVIEADSSSEEDCPLIPALKRSVVTSNLRKYTNSSKTRKSSLLDQENVASGSPRRVFTRPASKLNVSSPFKDANKRNRLSDTTKQAIKPTIKPLLARKSTNERSVLPNSQIWKDDQTQIPTSEMSPPVTRKPRGSQLAKQFEKLDLLDSDSDFTQELENESDFSFTSPRKTRTQNSQLEDSKLRVRPNSSTLKPKPEEIILVDSEQEDSDCEVIVVPETAVHAKFTAQPKIAASTRPSIALTKYEYPQFMTSLLEMSDTPIPYDFTSFVNSPPPPFAASSGSKLAEWLKIGEASYSEVFSSRGELGEELVIKIIPVLMKDCAVVDLVQAENDLPFLSDWSSVQREIWVSSLLGDEQQGAHGFVKFKGAFIVQGCYPQALLRQWDIFRKTSRDQEQIRPDSLPDNQIYGVICLSHAGTDLETFKLKNWRQALSIFSQTVKICAEAEEKFEFEHRDLHWGNLLVSENQKGDDVVVTLIDFTLSRAKSLEGNLIFDNFDDECIFEGQGDHQFDVYRSMASHVQDNWREFHPFTNLMWLDYLALKLLKEKKLKVPSIPPAADFSAVPAQFSPAKPRTLRNQPSRRALTASNTPVRSSRSRALAGKALSKALNFAQLAEMKAEREAWEKLVLVQQKLKIVLNQESTRSRPKKTSIANSMRDKAGKGEDWKSAADLFAWWQQQI